jgi:O-antigen/teichoic acid export membrane protein
MDAGTENAGWPRRLFLRDIGHRLTSDASRATASAVIASLVGQLAQLVSGVASARLLGADLRGQLALLTMIPGVASQVAHLGVPSAVAFFTARQPDQYRSIGRSGIRAALPSSIAGGVAAVAIVLALGLARSVGFPVIILIGTFALVPLYIGQLVALASFQGRRLFLPLNVQRVLPLILNATMLVLLLWSGFRSVAFALVILLASQIVGTVLSIRSAGLARSADGQRADPNAILSFGLRGLPSTLSPVETFRADQFIVGIFFGTTALGYYAAATAFSVFPRLVAQSIGIAAFPYVASKGTAAGMARTAWSFILATLVIVAVITIGLELTISPLTELLFGREFLPAIGIGRLLLVAAAFMSCRRLVADCSRAIGRPDLDSISEVSSWPVLVGGLFVLAPAYGPLGVAAVMAAAYAVAMAVALALLAWALHPRRARLIS